MLVVMPFLIEARGEVVAQHLIKIRAKRIAALRVMYERADRRALAAHHCVVIERHIGAHVIEALGEMAMQSFGADEGRVANLLIDSYARVERRRAREVGEALV